MRFRIANESRSDDLRPANAQTGGNGYGKQLPEEPRDDTTDQHSMMVMNFMFISRP